MELLETTQSHQKTISSINQTENSMEVATSDTVKTEKTLLTKRGWETPPQVFSSLAVMLLYISKHLNANNI